MKRFLGNQPITLSNENFDKKMMYYLTYKLDGKRHLYQNGYLITSKLEKFRFPLNVPHGTLLDGELYEGKYYAFDILFYKNNDIRKLNFTERLNLLENIEKHKDKNWCLKRYWSPYDNSIKNNFYEIKKLYKKDMKIGGKVDGVIFTPDTNYYATVLKWKQDVTIDFKIHKVIPCIFELLLQNGSVYTKVKLTQKQFDTYQDNTVVEFMWKKKFIPIRARPDKINSNYTTVIDSNWKQIETPVNMRSLLSHT
jgi:hypothetical protein